MHQVRQLIFLILLSVGSTAAAETITECKQLLQSGQYVACLDAATAAIDRRSYGEEWPLLKAQCERALGRYVQAQETIAAGIERYSWSIRLRVLAMENSRLLGDTEHRSRMIDEINRLATSAPWRYTDADDLVALGQTAVALGADPRDVLEGFYERARRNYASRPDGSLAAGELALDKGDQQLAAEILRPAVEQFPDHPELCFALASAIGSVEPERASVLLQHALEINPNFQPALIHLAEQQIDGESYDDAIELLQQVLKVNPRDPSANALFAVIHHLRSEPLLEAERRSRALTYSESNPKVDHIIGQKLSRKYRFREGAQYQQQALLADPGYLPARVQLAQDLLRLGQEERGWQLAKEARQEDQYNTNLFNLMQLRDSLDGFQELRTERFIVRMNRQEAIVYGAQVLQLLDDAFDVLTEKYGFEPDEPVTVEIFDQPQDFAVRTFGVPDVAGFLGVCFGKLITANSPASQRSSPVNWQSVLWHEFCHVITLQMTGNRIPRWLSEGISVYEERQRDPRWGQSMDPASRERVLSGRITPVSELSSAFLKAGSGEDLNFAYYESSMVVEYLVQQYGFDALLKILGDLQTGLTINDALSRHTTDIAALDQAFETWFRQQAEQYAPEVQFAFPDRRMTAEQVQQIAAEDPQHYAAGLQVAAAELKAGQLEAAEARLKQLLQLFPHDSSPNSARRLLAEVYRQQNNPTRQRELLAEHLELSDSDLEAALQLLQLHVAEQDWEAALQVGQLVMAIDPLRPEAVRQIADAATKLEDVGRAVEALEGLLELDPADAAQTHFRIASLLQSTDPAQARRHVLLALAEAPRYRAAHRLLLALTADASPAAN